MSWWRRSGRRARWWAAAAVLALLGGCTPPGLPAAQAPSSVAGPTIAAPTQELTVGIDGPVYGFNPYLSADFSTVNQAVSHLVLPSVSTIDSSGKWVVNPSLITAMEVTSRQPFTVTYRIDRNAAWSDGTPVTAEDFRYLARQLVSTDGTIDAAPYRNISTINSLDGGKTVEVQFISPVDQWQGLFSPLLPAHILKDAPGGFSGALAQGLPVSGNQYKLDTVDRTTGLITLVRNDKYWAGQSGPDTVVLRLGAADELVRAISTGDITAVLVRPGRAGAAKLVAAIPPDRRTDVPMPATVQLVFNVGDAQGPTAKVAVRQAIATALGTAGITDALTDSNPDALLPNRSFVHLTADPSSSLAGNPPQAGSADDLAGDRVGAQKLLAAAGFATSGLYATSADGPLRVTIGYPDGDDRMAAGARTIAQQLGQVGIEVNLARVAPGALAQQVADGAIDAALVTVPRGPSDLNAAASAVACPLPGDPAIRGGNLGGYCSSALDAELDTGLGSVDSDLAAIEALLVADQPAVVLGEPVATFAVNPELAPVLGASGGWLWTGPLADLRHWPTR